MTLRDMYVVHPDAPETYICFGCSQELAPQGTSLVRCRGTSHAEGQSSGSHRLRLQKPSHLLLRDMYLAQSDVPFSIARPCEGAKHIHALVEHAPEGTQGCSSELAPRGIPSPELAMY